MKNKIKAVIFDMDGTIVDSESLHTKAIETLLHELGVKPIYNKNGLIQKVGFAGEHMDEEILTQHKLVMDPIEFRKLRREIFMQLVQKELQPMKGFSELILRLKKERLTLAVASNRSSEQVIIMIERVGFKQHFAVILGKMDHLKYKPEPDIYLEAANLLKIDSKDCVAIEDSEAGVLSAKAAGMKVIAVPNKYTMDHNFSVADKIVLSLEEIDIDLINCL